MLETPEAQAKLRRKLETWPDDRKSPVTINQGLELLNMVERLEKEADWLAMAQQKGVDEDEPSRCPDGKEPPFCAFPTCKECWRYASKEASSTDETRSA